MQGTDFSEGTQAAAKAEKIRSFQNVFLAESESEINNISNAFQNLNENFNHDNEYNFPKNVKFEQENNFQKHENFNEANNFQKTRKDNIKCFSCGRYGHTSADCNQNITNYPFVHQQNNGYQNQFQNYNLSNNNRFQNPRSRPITNCDFCLKMGHEYHDCYLFKDLVERGIVSPGWGPGSAGQVFPQGAPVGPGDAQAGRAAGPFLNHSGN